MRRQSLTILAFSLLLTGCGSCLGESPEGTTEDGWFIWGPTAPIAVGTTLPVVVLDAHDEVSLLPDTDLRDVRSGAEEIVSVEDSRGVEMILRGESEGSARIAFSGVSAGERRQDAFTSFTETPNRMQLSLECTRPEVHRGQKAEIAFTFEPYSLGEGWYPVVIEPASAASVDVENSTYDSIVLDVSETAPDSFSVTVDTSTGLQGNAVTIDVVDEAPGGVIVRSDQTPDTFDISPQEGVDVRFRTADQSGTSCAVYPVAVTTTGPCGFLVDGGYFTEAETLSSNVEFVALAASLCIVEVAITVGSQLLTDQVSLDVEGPRPVSSGTGSGGGGGGFDFD